MQNKREQQTDKTDEKVTIVEITVMIIYDDGDIMLHGCINLQVHVFGSTYKVSHIFRQKRLGPMSDWVLKTELPNASKAIV